MASDLFKFVSEYIVGDMPFGFEWVSVFVGLFILIMCITMFFSLIDFRNWFKL